MVGFFARSSSSSSSGYAPFARSFWRGQRERPTGQVEIGRCEIAQPVTEAQPEPLFHSEEHAERLEVLAASREQRMVRARRRRVIVPLLSLPLLLGVVIAVPTPTDSDSNLLWSLEKCNLTNPVAFPCVSCLKLDAARKDCAEKFHGSIYVWTLDQLSKECPTMNYHEGVCRETYDARGKVVDCWPRKEKGSCLVNLEKPLTGKAPAYFDEAAWLVLMVLCLFFLIGSSFYEAHKDNLEAKAEAAELLLATTTASPSPNATPTVDATAVDADESHVAVIVGWLPEDGSKPRNLNTHPHEQTTNPLRSGDDGEIEEVFGPL